MYNITVVGILWYTTSSNHDELPSDIAGKKCVAHPMLTGRQGGYGFKALHTWNRKLRGWCITVLGLTSRSLYFCSWNTVMEISMAFFQGKVDMAY